jgi:hypothetical protein
MTRQDVNQGLQMLGQGHQHLGTKRQLGIARPGLAQRHPQGIDGTTKLLQGGLKAAHGLVIGLRGFAMGGGTWVLPPGGGEATRRAQRVSGERLGRGVGL